MDKFVKSIQNEAARFMPERKILIVVGTRPNFIKITQFPKEFSKINLFDWKILHTGQHYDDKMSKIFFEQFNIAPDIYLGVEGGSQAAQMAEMIAKLEVEMKKYRPDLVMVAGDVNSTFAGAFTANRLGIKVAHVESGLRSFDSSMPEEWNRLLTDTIADYLFVTEESGMANLKNEGKPDKNIFFVGNTMIDTLVAFHDKIDQSAILTQFNLIPKEFILMTMHRPATVDNKEGLEKLIRIINNAAKKYKIVFPIHPRTIKNLKEFDLYQSITANKNLILSEPLDYFSFQKLTKECLLVLSDSGGIQEETTFLKIPCLTLRANTERPATVSMGTNELIPFDERTIEEKILEIENGNFKKGIIPLLWDGKATERIVKILTNVIS